jgi:hypothetical protein
MKTTLAMILAALGSLWGGMALAADPSVDVQAIRARRDNLYATMNQGNYKDAYDGLRKIILAAGQPVGSDLSGAVKCLEQLNRDEEIDELLESAVKAQQDDPRQWSFLWEVAERYVAAPKQGVIIAGKFHRGPHRGGAARWASAAARDRVRALELMTQAWPNARKDDDHRKVSEFLLAWADMLLNTRGHQESWRLQTKTDLGVLPDYEEGWPWGWGFRGGQVQGAPVETDGKPIFYTIPKSWDQSENDGQRWRWCLQQAVEFDAERGNEVRMKLADFLQQQFGVQTIADFGWRFGRVATDDSKEDQSGTYALATLGEGETIARLATGVKRFKLPDEFNYIKIYQQVADNPKTGRGADALDRLATEFENRRQYPKAADYLRRAIKEYPGDYRAWLTGKNIGNSFYTTLWNGRLEQIEGNWGRFEPVMMQPAGQGATVEYRFRNGQGVELTAHEIKVEKLLEDVKENIKSRPAQVDWGKVTIGDIGYRLVVENQKQYLGPQVAQWSLPLKPRPAHFDQRITVATPLQKAGAYLLTAKMKGGNTAYIIIWLADTAIVRKPLDGKNYYYIADAASGAPVAKAEVEFFGWFYGWSGQTKRAELQVKQFAEYADADGQLFLDGQQQPPGLRWLVIARTKEGRLAYLGFYSVWCGNWYDAQYNATKVFAITDRPVYRPEQTVKYKFWVEHAQYDQADTSAFAGQPFTIEIHNPKGEKVVSVNQKADAYGGLEGEYKLPAEATLGSYGMAVKQGNNYLGGGNFRVEEYKKPEFEVNIEAPSEPVMLGEKIAATIEAKYYFGSPVAHAKVKYKITRTGQTEHWYPWRRWDWLYGPGYWWFAYDCPWYPGWRHWGCLRPIPFWWPQAQQPPELVAERELEIGQDGKVKVEIDTELAKAIHPDEDHRYTITAEVVDASRRTIVGEGTVLVARQPFKVYAWVDRGYYRVGDTIHASFNAHTLDNKPVPGQGTLTLLRITYRKDKTGNLQPLETPVETWSLATDQEGQAQEQLTASQAGQYRLSYKLTDSKKHTIEGGYLFTVIGEGFDSAEFRFNHLELIPERADYAPGEKIKLQINTDRAGGTVLLFLRPADGVYLPPQVIRLDGKSTVAEVEVTKKDMPNFFVEAVTVADGRVYSEVRQITVPPESRVLDVAVIPSATTYRPGQKARVKIKLTDARGKPFVGSTVVAIYDKSVEYISGGSNVPEIKEFFWKWQRYHYPRTESNLGWMFFDLVPPGALPMGDLGVFGATAVEDRDSGVIDLNGRGETGLTLNGEGGGQMFRMGRRMNTLAKAEAGEPGSVPVPLPAAPKAKAGANHFGFAPSAAASSGPGGGAAPLVQPTLRTKFADTALWVANLTTQSNGTAEVALDMPENLTTWRIKVWGMGHGAKVGQGQTDVITRKDLIVRLEAPRFFVQTDEVVLSAIVHNFLKTKKSVQVAMELGGKMLQPLDDLARTVEIAPQGQSRVDWRVKVLDEGEAVVRMKALTDEESDAMEQRFPCYIHGMLKMEAWSGVIRPQDTAGQFSLRVPEARRPQQSRIEVRYSPTLAGAMVDALPYLVDYPYGCTEQTLNRFLPTVITQKVLLEMHLNLEEIRKKRTNLNAQEIGDDAERAKQWKRYDRNPVFDEDEVRKMVKDGVERLTEMQLSDGGWGWFSGWGERSWPHTTALVVHGLQIARQNDVAVVPGTMDRGVEWLRRYQDEQIQWIKNWPLRQKQPELPAKPHADELDAFVYMVLVDAGIKNAEMLAFLYRDRTEIAVYAKAMFGIALEKQGEKEKLAMILRNIGQYVQQDDENQTAWLNLPGGYWWYWYGSEYEADAYYLKLLARTDPKGELAPRLVKYLLNNRKNATYWTSTRDTAIVVEAMADFVRASGQQKPEMTVQVFWDGKQQKAVEITPQTLFQFDNKFVLEGEAVTTGKHDVKLVKQGAGPLYYNGYLTNFTLEDFITKAGLEIKVQRKYYKLNEVAKSIDAAGSRGQAVEQKVEKYQREPLENLATLKSGDLVEVELEIDSKNDYEYLVFEDMKPAGFEPVDLRSGYTGNDLGAYVEYRDNRVVFFAGALARGKHSVSYRMRAEIPGRFSALPTRAWAMYAPELKANSDEIKLKVRD